MVVEHQSQGHSHVYIESGVKMNNALESGDYGTIFMQSPSIIATRALYSDQAELDRMFVTF
jgi:hypothetical protein